MTGLGSEGITTGRLSATWSSIASFDLLPDCEAATLKTWLAELPTITIIARDSGAGYIQTVIEGRPEATQVADRWHLMENASAAFLTAVQ